jgi:hypothetical protein
MRSGTSGSQKDGEAQSVQKQKNQLRSSGRVKDAAALFEQLLD